MCFVLFLCHYPIKFSASLGVQRAQRNGEPSSLLALGSGSPARTTLSAPLTQDQHHPRVVKGQQHVMMQPTPAIPSSWGRAAACTHRPPTAATRPPKIGLGPGILPYQEIKSSQACVGVSFPPSSFTVCSSVLCRCVCPVASKQPHCLLCSPRGGNGTPYCGLRGMWLWWGVGKLPCISSWERLAGHGKWRPTVEDDLSPFFSM